MTPYRRTELALSLFVVALGVATVIGARYTIEELEVLQDTVGARGFAYVIGSLVALGGVILVIGQIRAIWRDDAEAPARNEIELGGDDPRFPASAAQAFGVFAALVGYALLLFPAGYIVATALFLAAGTRLMGGRGWGRLALYPVIYAVATFLLFDTVLRVRIPDGVLRPLVVAIGLG